MQIDPQDCCVRLPEVRRWAVVHDLVAHPLLAITGYSAAARRFHDWTSRRAWPRPAPVVRSLGALTGLVVVPDVSLWRTIRPHLPPDFRAVHPGQATAGLRTRRLVIVGLLPGDTATSEWVADVIRSRVEPGGEVLTVRRDQASYTINGLIREYSSRPSSSVPSLGQ